MPHNEKADTPEGNIAHYKGNTLQFLLSYLRWDSDLRKANKKYLPKIRTNLGRLVVLTRGKHEANQAAITFQNSLGDYIKSPTEEKYNNLKNMADQIKI